MGTGLQRSLECPDHCNGKAADARLLTPTALTSGPDGSLYVGDFNLVRRITPEGVVTTVLQLGCVFDLLSSNCLCDTWFSGNRSINLLFAPFEFQNNPSRLSVLHMHFTSRWLFVYLGS